MHYAIIAAGEGSRLREEGIAQPKPLVRLQGMAMIDRLLQIFLQNHAESVSIIVNREMTEVKQYLEKWAEPAHLQSMGVDVTTFQFHLIEATTPSSMHSFAALADTLPEGKFCLTTVDTVFQPHEFARFIAAFEQQHDDADGLFVVTPYVDDEKPLYVYVEDVHSPISKIVAFEDEKTHSSLACDKCCLVSGGVYGLWSHTAIPILRQCLASGQSRMRNYQRSLLAHGLNIMSYTFGQVMDIDHAADIDKAEAFLADAK